jgi:hypothetical protein
MNVVAKYYQVEQHWNSYTNTSSIRIQCTRPEKKINLLLIVKTKSEVVIIWIKNANIPHFKAVSKKPIDHFEDFLNDNYPAEMLTKCFQVQAFYPTQVFPEVNHLMNTLRQHSEWISTNKIFSADKTISKLLSIAIKDILKDSNKVQRYNLSPQLTHQFVYQKDTTVASYQKALDNEGNDNNFAYCSILRSDPWEQLIKGPFDKDNMKAYLRHTVQEKKIEQLTQSSLW